MAARLFGFAGQDFGNSVTEVLAANLKTGELTASQDAYLVVGQRDVGTALSGLPAASQRRLGPKTQAD
ncbi:hypothetical protein A1353_19710 [Methylomonas methanica]|uniref:Uncharacterized protein n=1 Tax=Methylomonas methanica TaxID=421 RepID=A0A177M5U3_METMH|nr:hypothetical protein A1353_19710 [Methylomonas methanica]